jgi:adenylosuccinate lyase/3-carboxy-cis,cis-muconate cycloisomerase
MPSHPIDFQIQSNVFATPELAAIFDEQARFARWLRIEAALAEAQAELKVIPAAAAQEIVNKARISELDMAQLAHEYTLSRNSLMPLIKTLKKACKNNHGEFVHFGITTQDVIDTGQILELKEFFHILYRDIRRLEDILLDLAIRYQQTPMIGRTHGQQAIPITFGFKITIWAVEIRRHIERIKSLGKRTLVGQLGGAVGTMAALGPYANEIAQKTFERLGLRHCLLSWHTSRDNIAEFASCLAILSGTLEKIANEIFQLGKTELGELKEAAPGSAPSSSTMPHKNNPVLCQRIAVLSRQTRALSTLIIDAMVHEHERDPRALWSEWLNIPQISIYTGTAVHYLNEVMRNLTVDSARMLQNLYLQKDMVVSEWLLFQLGARIGKMNAQEKLQGLIRKAQLDSCPLKQLVLDDPELGQLLNKDQLEFLDHPERYVGQAEYLIQQSIGQIKIERQNDPEYL